MATFLDNPTYTKFRGSEDLTTLADQFHAQLDEYGTFDAPTPSDSLTNPLGSSSPDLTAGVPVPAAATPPVEQNPLPSAAAPPAVSDFPERPVLDTPTALQPSRRGDLVPNQFASGLSYEDALAACGPVAAVALARAYGNDIPVQAALAAAKRNGWTQGGGMNGMTNQQRTLTELGIATHLDPNPNEQALAHDASTGNPVTISTPKHYYVANDYNPQTGQFFVGQSGLAFKFGGGQWMTLAQIRQQGGGINGALFVDNPTTPTPSIATLAGGSTEGPVADRLQAPPTAASPLDQIADAFRGKLDDLGLAAGQAKESAGTTLQSVADAFHEKLNGALSGASTLQAGQEAQTRGTAEIPGAIGKWMDEPNPMFANVIGAQTKTMQQGAGVSPYEPGAQGLTQPEEYAQARAIASGLAQSLVPEELIARGAATGAGALSKSGQVAREVATSRQAAEIDPMLASGGLGRVIPEAAAAAPHGLTINLSKYPEELQPLIQEGYDRAAPQMDAARRGVLPDAVVRDLAQAAGTTIDKVVSKWKPGQAGNAETLLALRESFAAQGQRVIDAQAAVKAGDTSDNLLNLVQELNTHRALQEVVTGETAEAGRAMRSFRQPVSGETMPVQTLNRILKNTKLTSEELAEALRATDLSDPGKVGELSRTIAGGRTFGDKLSALWYFSLLSSPVTHIKNLVSNVLTAAVSPLETAAAVPFDVARVGGMRLIGKAAQRQRYIGEVPSQYVGMAAGMQDGVANAWQIMRRGFTNAEIGLKPELVGREAFTGRVADLTVNVPGRALRASDVFFRSINQTASIYGEAYRIAKQAGLKGDALVNRVAEIRANPSIIPGLLERAQTNAAYRVFQQDGTFVRAVGSFRQSVPASRFIVPFVQTPFNIAKYALERTPLALVGIGKDLAQGKLVAKGGGDLADRLARMTMGSATGYALWRYAEGGNLTGAAPRTQAEHDAFFREGKQPYSFKGPDGKWYSYAALQPFSTIFAAAAAAQEAQAKGDIPDALTGGTLIALTLARATLDQPWTQGMSDFLDYMGGANINNPGDILTTSATYAKKEAAPLVPSLVRWLESIGDDTIRDPQNPLQAVQARVPGLSAGVPAKLDAFGHDVKRPVEQRGLGGSLNIFKPSSPTSDPVERELSRLSVKGYRVEPGFVGKDITVIKQPVKLNDEQERRYQEQSGTIAYAILANLVDTQEWKGLSDANKALTVTRIVDKTREYARTQMTPELLGQAVSQYVEQEQKRAAP